MTYSSRVVGAQAHKRPSAVVLVLLVGLVGLATLKWLQTGSGPAPATVVLTVQSGEVTVTRADAGELPVLRESEKFTLQRGDEVRTSVAGKSRLTFPGGETCELGSSTDVQILELYQAPVSKALTVVLALNEGKTTTRIRHMLLPGMKFQIDTPVATVQAKGTFFRCDVLGNDRITVVVYDGVVNVSMGEASLDVLAGQGVEAVLGRPLEAVAMAVPSPMFEDEGDDQQSGAPTLTEREKTLFPPVVTPTRPGDRSDLYTVREGDTLYSIAREFGVGWDAIWAANKDTLKKPELIRAGQKLAIPKP
ncbi:MAG: LysM peptidoglycan-binding domain-containing protein [Anaerolineae bacterium]